MSEDILKIEAVLDNLDTVISFVETQASLSGLAPEKTAGIPLVIEEAFVNICSYAYEGHKGDISVSCINEPESMTVKISDSGAAFDILSIPDPDTTSDIDDRKIGGLGVFFIRQFTDELSYRRENGCNILTLVFRNTSHHS